MSLCPGKDGHTLANSVLGKVREAKEIGRRDGEKEVGSCVLSRGSDGPAEAQSPVVVLAAISSPDRSLPQGRDLYSGALGPYH